MPSTSAGAAPHHDPQRQQSSSSDQLTASRSTSVLPSEAEAEAGASGDAAAAGWPHAQHGAPSAYTWPHGFSAVPQLGGIPFLPSLFISSPGRASSSSAASPPSLPGITPHHPPREGGLAFSPSLLISRSGLLQIYSQPRPWQVAAEPTPQGSDLRLPQQQRGASPGQQEGDVGQRGVPLEEATGRLGQLGGGGSPGRGSLQAAGGSAPTFDQTWVKFVRSMMREADQAKERGGAAASASSAASTASGLGGPPLSSTWPHLQGPRVVSRPSRFDPLHPLDLRPSSDALVAPPSDWRLGSNILPGGDLLKAPSDGARLHAWASPPAAESPPAAPPPPAPPRLPPLPQAVLCARIKACRSPLALAQLLAELTVQAAPLRPGRMSSREMAVELQLAQLLAGPRLHMLDAANLSAALDHYADLAVAGRGQALTPQQVRRRAVENWT